jgi:MerR family transcriptional regulator, mercuric resistance operon regulatory protein
MNTIAGFARAGGVSVETIRFYQRRGLLRTPVRPASTSGGGGARRYGAEDLERLRFIRSAQTAGFTLEQIRELLSLDAAEDRERVRELARMRIADLDARIADLAAARDALRRLTEECRSAASGQPCPIIAAFAHH